MPITLAQLSGTQLAELNDHLRRTHWAKTNRVGTEVLGEKLGSAMQRLTREVLFEFVVSTGQNSCFRCGKPMTAQDFTLDHKESWLHSPDPAKAFWDRGNHSWSHHTCNSIHRFGFPEKYVKKEVKSEEKVKKVPKVFNIPEDLDDKVRDAATSSGNSKSEIVRQAVEAWLTSRGEEPEAQGREAQTLSSASGRRL